jgi:hypothetical protein
MDAFELLKADHKKVAELFDLLETASGKRKLDVFKRIKTELELHTYIEESIFYPALEKPTETHDLTLEAYEEHKVVKTLLGELSGAESANDEWQAKAKVLRENVEHHVDEEDKADDALSDEEIEALGERMGAEKARKQGQPVPEGSAKSTSKEGADKPGLISKIADFVGLGSSGSKEVGRKSPGKKKQAATKSLSKSKRAPSSAGSKRTPAQSPPFQRNGALAAPQRKPRRNVRAAGSDTPILTTSTNRGD